jgi:hypothetical protein
VPWKHPNDCVWVPCKHPNDCVWVPWKQHPNDCVWVPCKHPNDCSRAEGRAVGAPLVAVPKAVQSAHPIRGGLQGREEHLHSVRSVTTHAAAHAGAPLEGRLEGGARCAVKKSTRIPYAVLMGMLPRVPVRPSRGGLKEARGAPLRRARASVRRVDGRASTRAGAPLEGRLEGGARCAVKKSTRIPYAVLMGVLPRVPVRPLRGGLKEARGAP